ncbi:hypothetical protein BJV82DRAFT_672117 [Fennellomyces sp. T-0311]|nr:hypothetical protein BJV82DRAFT_672117 [Fennellomyces sp. T-0311]
MLNEFYSYIQWRFQQACKDFNIDYLRYDKICINHTNKEEKKREIKQMHATYSSAHYTIALVPEITIGGPLEFENDAYGGNGVYFWSQARDKQGNTTKENDFLCVQMLGFKDKKLKAQARKNNGKILALANILHDVIAIDIDYKSDLAVTMNSLYG